MALTMIRRTIIPRCPESRPSRCRLAASRTLNSCKNAGFFSKMTCWSKKPANVQVFLWHLPLLSRNPKNSCTFQVFAQTPHLFIKSLHFCRLSQECRPKQRKRGALALVGDPGLVMHDRHSALTGSHCHGLAQRSSPIGDLPARFRATPPPNCDSPAQFRSSAPCNPRRPHPPQARAGTSADPQLTCPAA